MAGLGEVCSHVGAILFYLETTARLSGQSQCTQEKCSWIVPAFQKTIPYLPISKIDFSSAKSKMKSINAAINTPMQAASLQPQASTTCIATCSTSIKMSNEQCVNLSHHFFSICILPELLGRWYSRPPSLQQAVASPHSMDSETLTDNTAATTATLQLYCYCKQPEDITEEWIGCDNPLCTIEWFHLRCLKMLSTPKGQWYCPDCRKLQEFKRSKH
jgi:hypothetical protein